MTVGSTLSFVGFVIAVLYLAAFFRAFARIGRTEANRFVSSFPMPKTSLVGAALIAAVLVVPNAAIATGLAVLGLVWLAYETRVLHRKMRELGFDTAFERQLFRISFLPPLAIACLLAGKFWFTSDGAS